MTDANVYEHAVKPASTSVCSPMLTVEDLVLAILVYAQTLLRKKKQLRNPLVRGFTTMFPHVYGSFLSAVRSLGKKVIDRTE